MQKVYIIMVKFCDYKRRITDNRPRYYRTLRQYGLHHLLEVPYFDKTRFAVVMQTDVPEWRIPYGAYIGNLSDYDNHITSRLSLNPESDSKNPAPKEGNLIETYPLRGWKDA